MNNENNILINESVLMAYINDELDSDKKVEVKTWLSNSIENANEFEELQKTWKLSGQLKTKPVVVNTDGAWENVFSKIDTETKVVDLKSKSKSKLNYKVILSIAALFAILFSVYKFAPSNEIETINLVATHFISSETLTDGSVITVNENSSLTYPSEFSEKERRVTLKGEAFFDIERNEEKPFVIDLPHNQFVKVLGTSFNINASENDSLTTVFVSSGKVEFGTEESHIILIKGETGVMNNKTKQIFKVTDKFSGIKNRYWQKKALAFNGDKLVDVVELLNDIFDETIILNCENTDQLGVTTKFKNESLEIILLVIAESNNLKVTTSENTHTISCNAD